jgi:hypothetical protein
MTDGMRPDLHQTSIGVTTRRICGRKGRQTRGRQMIRSPDLRIEARRPILPVLPGPRIRRTPWRVRVPSKTSLQSIPNPPQPVGAPVPSPPR